MKFNCLIVTLSNRRIVSLSNRRIVTLSNRFIVALPNCQLVNETMRKFEDGKIGDVNSNSENKENE